MSSRYWGKEGEFVSVLQDIICETMFTVDDLEEPDRSGDVQGTYDVIDGRAFREYGRLFIGAELAQRRKEPDRDVHK